MSDDFKSQLDAWLAKHGVKDPKQARGETSKSDFIHDYDLDKFAFGYKNGVITIHTSGRPQDAVKINIDRLRTWVKNHGKINKDNFEDLTEIASL